MHNITTPNSTIQLKYVFFLIEEQWIKYTEYYFAVKIRLLNYIWCENVVNMKNSWIQSAFLMLYFNLIKTLQDSYIELCI